MRQSFLSVLRLGIYALGFALLLGALVSGIGWLSGWRTAGSFSNGLSTTGAVLVVLGILSLMGGYRMRSNLRVPNSPPAGNPGLGDRTRQWASDATQGYRLLVLLFVAGLLLIGASILI